MTEHRNQEPERAIPSEFSRPTFLKEIPSGGARFDLVASDAECCALVGRFGLLSILEFRAEVVVTPSPGGGGAGIVGNLSARLTQECSVTLEPFEASVTGTFERQYVFSPPPKEEKSISLRVEDADPPEFIPSGWADLGEVVAEELGLRIDSFPRRPGVTFLFDDAEGEGQGGSISPFSALERFSLKK